MLRQKEIATGFFDKVATVRGVIKSQEAGVIIHLTSAPDFINNLIKVAIL